MPSSQPPSALDPSSPAAASPAARATPGPGAPLPATASPAEPALDGGPPEGGGASVTNEGGGTLGRPSGAPRITLTERAAHFVARKLAEQGEPAGALRVGVQGGGCNGLKYVLDITSAAPRARDLVYEFFGTRVLVDIKSVDFIEGAMVDYENTLMYQGLKVRNPQEASSCGCGETFSVSDEVYERRRQRPLRTTG